MDMAVLGLSYAGIALALLFFAVALAEQAWPAWQPGADTRRRWLANLGLYVCTEGLNLLVFGGLSLEAVVALPPVPAIAAFLRSGGTVAHAAAILLLLDLTYYLMHRLLHASPLLWRLHAVHHTDLDLDVTSTVRHHPLEIVPMVAAAAIVSAAIGAAPGEVAAYGVMAFAVQLLAHANLTLPGWLFSALNTILVTPAFHRLHHSLDERECHANYGEVFVFWDWMFGTAVSRSGSAPQRFGLAGLEAPRFQHIGWMLLQPVLSAPQSAARLPLISNGER